MSYRDQITDREPPPQSLKVGNRRFMIPLQLSGGLGAEQAYANPYVIALARMILEGEAIIDAAFTPAGLCAA